MSKLLDHNPLTNLPQIFIVQVQYAKDSRTAIQLCHLQLSSSISKAFHSIITKFSDVFEEPKRLPPHRSHDHKIILKDDNVAMSMRPYRYASAQKDILEVMIQELLISGVIQVQVNSLLQ